MDFTDFKYAMKGICDIANRVTDEELFERDERGNSIYYKIKNGTPVRDMVALCLLWQIADELRTIRTLIKIKNF